MLFTRLFIIGIVAITYLLSLGNVTSVFATGVWCFSGFSALFPMVVVALYWRGLSAAGAITMVAVSLITPKPNQATLAKFFDPPAGSSD